MHDAFKITLPKLGESILSATIVQWFKKVGDPVRKDEPLLEVSTDKVNSEIPSPVSGVLKEILAYPDQELNVGDLLAVVTSLDAAEGASTVHVSAAPSAPVCAERSSFFSPALLRLAQEKGIGLEELPRIPATGEGGRLTKKDVEAYASARSPETPDGVERVKMSGMRKAIADNMVRSFYEAPHATLVSEVDVTGVVQLMQREKERFLETHGCKLTITSFVVRALARALQEYPLLNSSLEQDTIVLKRFVNVGLAVSVEQGLMVPVIKQCQSLNVTAIAKQIHTLSAKARAGTLSPDDVSGGTVTLTNFGMSGVLIGVPIIRYPEVAIVGVGGIHKRVVPMEDETFAVRSLLHISLTFDHRVLDGMYGCGFLGALKKHMEESVEV
jgi:2-oxoglutarate dehydrogenase E2 component (dihydrolipoamide succinyltransferase)